MVIARGALCSSRSAWRSRLAVGAVAIALRGMTRKPARVSTASIQSAHIRSSGA